MGIILTTDINNNESFTVWTKQRYFRVAQADSSMPFGLWRTPSNLEQTPAQSLKPNRIWHQLPNAASGILRKLLTDPCCVFQKAVPFVELSALWNIRDGTCRDILALASHQEMKNE